VFLGIDFATKPRGTALTALEWRRDGEPRILGSWCPVDHALLVEVLSEEELYSVAAVDVPFGWPTAFVKMAVAHQRGSLEAVPRPADDAKAERWRTEEVALRATDRHVRDTYGIRPIAVAFDKFGATAAAWALIEASLPWPLDRSGQDENDRPRIIETYPAAQFCAWRPAEKRGGDKPGKPAKPTTLDDVLALAMDSSPAWPGLRSATATPQVVQLLEANPHARDSLVCAITAAMTAKDPANAHPMADDAAAKTGETASAEGLIWLHDPHYETRSQRRRSEKRGRAE
jgi:hypothetical protein